MEFAFTAEQEALRSDVQQFIAENVTDEIISELEDTGIRRRGPKTREMYRKIAERGWIGISWPTEYGGQDGSRIDQYIVEEEFARIGITVGGAGSGAPAILAAGTEEQKREFIPGVIRGEISFRPWVHRTASRRRPGRPAMPAPFAMATTTSSTARRCTPPPRTTPRTST